MFHLHLRSRHALGILNLGVTLVACQPPSTATISTPSAAVASATIAIPAAAPSSTPLATPTTLDATAVPPSVTQPPTAMPPTATVPAQPTPLPAAPTRAATAATVSALPVTRHPGDTQANSAELYDPASNSWMRTDGLAIGRTGHTAALLPDGKVLIVGGQGASCLAGLLSAELYDPATGTWSPTGSPASSRYSFEVIPLRDGRVLAVGGLDLAHNDAPIGSAELYDPATGAWTPTGSIQTPRFLYASSLLSDGRVLVAGGGGGNHGKQALRSAELYDPATGVWQQTSEMATARVGSTAIRLPNDRVLVVGGDDTEFLQTTAEIYDHTTNTWSPTSPVAFPLREAKATLLPNGKVLVVGNSESSASNNAELYDPTTDAWAPTGPMALPRTVPTAMLLPNGKVLVVGGYLYNMSNPSPLAAAELYDPARNVWTSAGTSGVNFTYNTATLLANGKVLVVGGQGNFAPDAPDRGSVPGTWTRVSNARSPHYNHTATLLTSGEVLVVGGQSGVAHSGRDFNTYESDVAEIYDPANNSWRPTHNLITKRIGHTATLLANGKVLVAGGWDLRAKFLASAELYDPAAGSWKPTGRLYAARAYHTATLLQDGRVLVVGGTASTFTGEVLASAELYDPANGTWAPIESLAIARIYHTATLLQDGRVLVVGGNTSFAAGEVLASAELYTPVTGTWQPTGSLNAGRQQHTATLLRDGRVLVAGGDIGCRSGGAEIYDPATNAWTSAGEMVSLRSQHTATLLPNGTVLLVGGPSASTEVFNPKTGVWSSAGHLAMARTEHTATLLKDGNVLIMGGKAYDALSSAELYKPQGH